MLSNCGVREDSWESLGQQRDKSVNPKGNQPWIFTRRTDAEAEAPILWPPDVKSWVIGKDPDVEKIEDKRRREWQRMRWWDTISDSMNLSILQERVEDSGAWHAIVCEVTKSWTQLSDWTSTTSRIWRWFECVCVCSHKGSSTWSFLVSNANICSQNILKQWIGQNSHSVLSLTETQFFMLFPHFSTPRVDHSEGIWRMLMPEYWSVGWRRGEWECGVMMRWTQAVKSRRTALNPGSLSF